MTYQNSENIINRMLNDLSKRPIDLVTEPPNKPKKLDDKHDEPLIGFFVSLDKEENILFYNSNFDISIENIEEGKILALNNLTAKYIQVEDTPYAFRIIKLDDRMDIHFVDITTHREILDRLLYTFIGVALLALVFIVFISNFLTAQSVKPIEEAFEKQNQFISDASHEIKTPLAVIQANSDVLKKELPNNPWVNYIQHEVQRMKVLTESLLDLSQFETADFSKEYTTIDLKRLIDHQYLILEALAFEKKIKVINDLSDNLETKGHKDQLKQVICILLDNALKYTPEDGEIRIRSDKTTNHLYIYIENSGPLVPKEHHNKLFDRFYQVDSSRSNDASYGLGLSIAKTIMLRHQGDIYFATTSPYNVFKIKMKTL